jgi:two-component system, LytTR family, response regulator
LELVNLIKTIIWIIEDEPLAIEILKDYIDRHSTLYIYKIMHNAQELQDVLSSNEFSDLVFMDLNLEGNEIMDFISKIQKHCCVLIITTAYIPMEIKSMLDLDYTDILFLHKPFSYTTFLSTINEALKKMEY